MASDIRVRVGTVTALRTLNATDQQVAEALRRYAKSLGIPTSGTAQEQLMAVIDHWIDDVRRVSKQVQANELRAVNEPTIQGQVESENNL